MRWILFSCHWARCFPVAQWDVYRVQQSTLWTCSLWKSPPDNLACGFDAWRSWIEGDWSVRLCLCSCITLLSLSLSRRLFVSLHLLNNSPAGMQQPASRAAFSLLAAFSLVVKRPASFAAHYSLDSQFYISYMCKIYCGTKALSHMTFWCVSYSELTAAFFI